MKNSQKNNARATSAFVSGKKSKKGQKGAPVRQKRAARAAVLTPPVEKKPPMPREKKFFISLTALLCALALSFLTLGSVYLVGVMNRVEYASLYEKINLKEYVRMEKSDYTNQKIDLSGVYRAPYTLDDMDKYVEELLFSKREEVALGMKTSPIGYGDDVECYVLGAFLVNDDGKLADEILTGTFADKDYSTAAYLTVGLGSSSLYGISFGRALDDAIVALGAKPVDTYRVLRSNGKLSGGEVIAISYTAVKADSYDAAKPENAKWGSTTTATSSSSRMDLAKLLSGTNAEKRLANAIIENCKEIEEPFEFVLTNYDSNGDKTPEVAVKYTASVRFVIEEETTTDVIFTLPADHFKETGGATKEQIALNGKKIALRMIFTYMNDYEVPSATAETLKGIDEGFETDKTSDADVLAAFKAYSLNKLNGELEKYLHEAYLEEALTSLAATLYQSSKGVFGAKVESGKDPYPDGTREKAWYRAYDELMSAYNASGFASYGYTLDQYVAYITGSQTSAQSYLNELADFGVAKELFIYYVFKNARLRVSDELLEETYKEYVDSLISSYSAQDEETEYNEEYLVNEYGKDALYTEARAQAVRKLVGEYLLENNELNYGN